MMGPPPDDLKAWSRSDLEREVRRLRAVVREHAERPGTDPREHAATPGPGRRAMHNAQSDVLDFPRTASAQGSDR